MWKRCREDIFDAQPSRRKPLSAPRTETQLQMQRAVISSDTKDARLGPKMKHGTHDENMRVEAAAKLMKSAKLLLKPKGGPVDSTVSATRQPDLGSVSIDEPRSAGGQATKALPNVPLQPKRRDGLTTTTIVTTVTATTATSSEKKPKKLNSNWHVKDSLRAAIFQENRTEEIANRLQRKAEKARVEPSTPVTTSTSSTSTLKSHPALPGRQ